MHCDNTVLMYCDKKTCSMHCDNKGPMYCDNKRLVQCIVIMKDLCTVIRLIINDLLCTAIIRLVQCIVIIKDLCIVIIKDLCTVIIKDFYIQ